MDYNNFENYIAAYIDGELSDNQKNEFEELMRLNEECKIKFKQTTDLLDNLRSMPKLQTDDNFLTELHEKIELKERFKTNFLDKLTRYFLDAKPAFSFAISVGAIAIFTFVYLNDLEIFNQGIVSNDKSKTILKDKKIDIELARGIEKNNFLVEEEMLLSGEFDKDSLDEDIEENKVKFNFKEAIKDVIEEIKVNRTFTKENE